MSPLPLRLLADTVPAQARAGVQSPADLATDLLQSGLVSPHDMVQALSVQASRGTSLAELLLRNGMIAEDDLLAVQARHFSAQILDPLASPPDSRLIDRFGLQHCLAGGLLPWRRVGSATVIATSRPESFARHIAALTDAFGPVIMALAPARAIEDALVTARRATLSRQADDRVPAAESCRDWLSGGTRRALLLGGIVVLVLAAIWPLAAIMVLTGWTILTLLLSVALKLAATFAALRRRPPPSEPPVIARMPTVSIMVALFREPDIAPRLVQRLSRIDYPRDLLDILLVVEEEDDLTRRALANSSLPRWMRIVVVPTGPLKTKPRALNFALNFCRGSIIGVYDAEDAPDSDQLLKVVRRFHERDPKVACLQGVLDFYNPRTNWLSRCFTLEYAAWFRIILPGLERMGLTIPLGGTTLFFRRDALEELGGWDAHNVTEDADLGIRLARHGYRTELIETVTHEEANCHTLPWVRQRSRWLKGYMMTWAVHNRNPGLLWRQLGAWRFFGVQVLFLGTISQYLLAPVLWSFWIVPFGFYHPVASVLPGSLQLALFGLFLLTEAVNTTVAIIACRSTRHRMLWAWVPILHFYFPLGALASYKAGWELLARPFYWDKTSHGIYDEAETISGS